MTSTHRHVFPCLWLISPNTFAVLRALVLKIRFRTCTHSQMPLSQSWPHWSRFARRSDAPFMTLFSLFRLSRKCTPPQSCLPLPCGHANVTRRPSLAGLFIPQESRATSTLLSTFHSAVLSPISLSILTPNIPESGTKSRVETQVRVTVDLTHASTSAGDQNQYDRVGSWKWLKLPPGTSTKRRSRREGKIGNVPCQ